MPKKSEPRQYIPVFVGSTYEDLKSYREAVKDALVRLEAIVHGMEFFGSKPGNPKEECLKAVRKCKVYIGIFAMRYGSVDPDTGKSMTHLEYEEAQHLELPSLIYLIDEENQPVLPKFVDSNDKAKNLKELKNLLKKKHVVSFFTNPESLARQISQDLPSVLKEIGAEVMEEEQQEEIDLAELIRRFSDRPKKYANQEIIAKVKFTHRPMNAWDDTVNCFNLELGDTLRAHGEFSGLGKNLDGQFYACGEMADWLENIKPDKEYTLQLRMIFGTSFEVEYADDASKAIETAEHGYLILSVR